VSTLILFIFFFSTLFLAWVISKKWLRTSSPLLLPFLLVLKYFIAISYIFIYSDYSFSGNLSEDVGYFFQESKQLYEVFNNSPHAFAQLFFGLNNDPEFIDLYLSNTSHWNGGDRVLPNDSRSVMRVNALIYFISQGNYYLHFLVFSFISFLGSFDLFQFIRKQSQIPQKVVLLLILFMPSITFWTSSIIKEPLMLVGLFLLIRGVFDHLKLKNRLWRILFGTILLIGFKSYVLIVFFVSLLFYFIFSRIFKLIVVNLLVFSVFGLALLYITELLPKFTRAISAQQEEFINLSEGGLNIKDDQHNFYYISYKNRANFEVSDHMVQLKDSSEAIAFLEPNGEKQKKITLTEIGSKYKIVQEMKKAGSRLKVTRIDNQFSQMLKMIPAVLVNTHLRPFPWKQQSFFSFILFAEKLFFIIGLVLCFIFFPRRLSTNLNKLIWSLVLFSFLVSLLVGWTTPVVGAIVRYIIPAQAALLVVILIKLDWGKLKGRLSK
jgi:hypothetical protein